MIPTLANARPRAAPGRRFSRRLLAAAEMVPPGSRVADIGSGHGLLPLLLIASRRVSFCIAGERSAETLARVRPLPARLAGHLELRHGEGLAVLEPGDRVDLVTLLGLGTRSIARILEPSRMARLGIRRVVLQPQTEWPRLRAGLLARGLAIRDERLVQERGRIYLLLAAEPASDPTPSQHPDLSLDELLEVGPIVARRADPLARTLWRAELRRRRSIADRATGRTERREARAACERARRIASVLEAGAVAPGGIFDLSI